MIKKTWQELVDKYALLKTVDELFADLVKEYGLLSVLVVMLLGLCLAYQLVALLFWWVIAAVIVGILFLGYVSLFEADDDDGKDRPE